MNDILEIGKIGKTHGFSGELKFHMINPDSTNIKEGLIYILKEKGRMSFTSSKKVKVASVKFGHSCRIRFEGIESKEEAKKIVNFHIFCERGNLPEIKGDEFYLCDMLGSNVYSKDRKNLGRISKYYNNKAHEVACLDGGEEFPLVPDFIESFCKSSKKLVLKVTGDFFESM